jgi:hypothetical protein
MISRGLMQRNLLKRYFHNADAINSEGGMSDITTSLKAL